ncbi:hypothetical protein LPUS_11908 [Lasallia pustulata]|uniref:Uncharacterized protein n=1 Tax=Lasallia pustulata TaxID=136370 RepID=A0A1W5DCY8_9LECA|nr:hypothetical protein LPUS_11908 [Lasallia pustulata]
MCARFGITQASFKKNLKPLNGYDQIQPAMEGERYIDVSEYQQAVGSFMHAMVYTRPDIAFATGKVAQFMSAPVERHGQAVKNLFRYLKTTASFKLRFGPGGISRLVVYADSDWDGDRADRKSTSGSVAKFYDGSISWGSKKQKSVLRDLDRGKYIGSDPRMVQMCGDNQGALELIKNPHLHDRSKHIDIQYHYVRDLYEDGRIELEYILTDEMPADGLTKPLESIKFARFRQMLGMVQ